jgi:hypothetical protein
MPIPKIIHYCWLSGEPYPNDIQECIDSWHEFMPDYEFKLWDCNSFDVDSVTYVKQAVEAKKWAFASDYIRLWALYKYGGIYLDSDIKVLKSFDDLLNEKAFTAFESGGRVAAWIFGGQCGEPIFKELLSHYDNRHFIDESGKPDLTPNSIPVTQTLIRHGLVAENRTQMLDVITVFTEDYFSPFNPWTKRIRKTENTHAMHLFKGAWKGDKSDEEFMGRVEEFTAKFVEKDLNGKHLIIFGAGVMGHLVREFIAFEYPDVVVDAFLVTRNDTGFDRIEGVPVYEIGDSDDLKRETPVLVATISKYHEEIERNLEEAHYSSVHLIGDSCT